MAKKLIGNGMHSSKGSNRFIIRLETEAKIGQPVTDKNGRFIGKIFDVFGPVQAPFASIKISEGLDIGKPKGKPVFFSDRSDKRKKRRGRRKRRSR